MQSPVPIPQVVRDGLWTLHTTPGAMELLSANRLTSGDAIMGLPGGAVMRSVPGRSTFKFSFSKPGEPSAIVFLKRYELEYLTPAKRLLRRLGWPAAQDEALHEWRALLELRSAGFNTAWPIAAGQQRLNGVVVRSFLMTAEIPGGIAAHDYLRTITPQERRTLAIEAGRLTRAFLNAGFAHRDYYLSHIFVVPRDSSPVTANDLYLIDLQRVFKPVFLRQRWLVKDLGALAYTARLAGATRSDMLAFFRACFGPGRLTDSHKALIRRILSRVRALNRRGPKYDVVWDQPGVHPPNV